MRVALRAVAAAVGVERGSWSSNRRLLSCSRRPISVLLPSSTLPQVMKRSRPLCFVPLQVAGDVGAVRPMRGHQK